MKNNRISVSTNINIFRFLIIILGYFKLFIILNFITIIITLIISKGVLFSIVFEYFLVFFFGLIMSTYIHEYAHIYFLKMYGVEEIIIEPGMLRFRIIFENHLKGVALRRVALSGPLFCLIIGVLLWGIQFLVYSNDTINIIKIIYFVHVVNLLPVFGDGRCILKSIIS